MTSTRRQLLLGAAGLLGTSAVAACSSGRTAGDRGASDRTPGDRAATPAAPSAQPDGAVRHHYGPGPAQFADLYRPKTVTHRGVVVVIHGGFWQAQYDLTLGAPLAADLAGRGYVAYNLEYRRVTAGGGWPGTLDDVAAGIDQLAGLGLDTSRVVAIGHSAGGQLAVWAAGRPKLPAGALGAQPRVRLTAAISQAGVLDLLTAERTGVGGTAVRDFLGGTPGKVPERYREADPIEQVPLDVPVICLHSRTDVTVPFSQSYGYVAAANAAGGHARLVEVSGDHSVLIDPRSPAWQSVVAALPALFRQ